MDEDPSLIFTLTAVGDQAEDWFMEAVNKRYYCCVPPRPSPTVIATASRESTPKTTLGDDIGDGDDSRNIGNRRMRESHQLRFTFDRKPKNIEQGWVFGSNPKTCDVILGTAQDAVSGEHFRITFKDLDTLVLIDQSTHGTAVSYAGQARNDKRSNPKDRTRQKPRNRSNDFTWILFPGIIDKRIVLGHKIENIPEAPILECLVEVVSIEQCSEAHKTMREAYLGEMRTAIPFGLDIHSHSATAGQTEVQTPKQASKQQPIWIDYGVIGFGEFGMVHRAINRHVVSFEGYEDHGEWPRLIMEYLPLGNLAEQNEKLRINERETITLLYQGLDALDYLHGRKIVHRDLKPANILIHRRDRSAFCVKFADFGLATDDSALKTCCGTQLYCAPEIWENRPYTENVDIWSLGVITFEYLYGLPKDGFNPQNWYQRLAQQIQDWDSDEILEFLSSSMLTITPDERLPAGKCRQTAAKLLQDAVMQTATPEFDLGTPTERMSSSVMMHALQAAGYDGWQGMAADNAGAHPSAPSVFKSARRLNKDAGNLDDVAKGTEARRNSPSPIVGSIYRLERHLETNAQAWDPARAGNFGSARGDNSLQHAESGSGNSVQEKPEKRQRADQPDHDQLSKTQQPPWKRYDDPVLVEHPSSNLIKIILDSKPVSMRKSDFWLNATEITIVAVMAPQKRRQIFDIIKRNTRAQLEPTRHGTYIPYQDGRFLCEYLKLTDKLWPLLEYGEKQGASCNSQSNYLQPGIVRARPWETDFLGLTCGETTILIRRADFWINATQMLKSGGYDHAREMGKFRTEKGKEFDVVRTGGLTRGTYVHPLTALVLCKEYRLEELERILCQTLEDHQYWQGDLAAAFTSLAGVSVDPVERPASKNRQPSSGFTIAQNLVETGAGSRVCVNDTAKTRSISYYTEVDNNSFLPRMKGTF